MQEFPDHLIKARLIRRINRFVAEVVLNDKPLNVYVPNTGRLSELALPGAEVLLAHINAKYKYKILYILNRSFPVMIDSTYSNRLFHLLLKEKKVPGFNNYLSVKSEPVYGTHRFDFLLKTGDRQLYIELKSCTLFHNTTGSFPDAVSTRASEHVQALAESGTGNLIFLVIRSDINIFLPNYHTDFKFYETLKLNKDKINIHAFTVQYNDKLEIHSLKEIPVIIPEVNPSGKFLLLIFNSENIFNDDGEIFERGYYLYCGEEKENVFKTISAIKRKNGILSILPDKLFLKTKIISALPIIYTSITIEKIQCKLSEQGGKTILFKNRNKPDTHLMYFKKNPAEEQWFWNMILEWRYKEYS